tara:strand:- start:154 stop:372 length:219 start_codon:yes stop_codon:yes gene_type:complete
MSGPEVSVDDTSSKTVVKTPIQDPSTHHQTGGVSNGVNIEITEPSQSADEGRYQDVDDQIQKEDGHQRHDQK